MNLRTLLALLVVSSGVSLAAPNSATPASDARPATLPTTGLRFSVRDAQSHGVPYACVRLELEGSNLTAGPLWTDATGEAEIAELPVGFWRWTVSAAAVGAVEGRIEVLAGKQVPITARIASPTGIASAGRTIDFGRGVSSTMEIAPSPASRGNVATEKVQVNADGSAPVVQERDPSSNGDGKFALPLTRTLANTLPTGKSGLSLSYAPARATAPLVLTDFGGAASNGAALPGTSWDGAAAQTGGLLVVSAPAVSEQGWGWSAANAGEYLNLSAFDTLTVTAQQGAGNAAGNFSILFFDPNENFSVVTLSMANFLGSMNAAAATISWGSVDATKVSKWTLGGDFPFPGDAFRLSIDSIVLTTAIPEPSTYGALAGAGALALAWWRRRRKA